MPIYEYHCASCEKDFEELVFGDDAEVSCPACGSGKTEKLISRCRFKADGRQGPLTMPPAMRSQYGLSSPGGGSKCGGCSGGDCSSC